MLEPEVKDVAQRIGQFYLAKHNNDYDATATELLRLQITQLTIEDDVVTITTARPGLLIGKRGQNVEALENHLNAKVKIKEELNSLFDWIMPVKEEDWDDDDYWPTLEDFADEEDELRQTPPDDIDWPTDYPPYN